MKRLLLFFFVLLPASLLAQHRDDSARYVLPPFADQTLNAVDSVAPIKSPLQLEWDQQTQEGALAHSEKVTAGFYHTAPKAGIYAFYTEAARGRILRVRNLNNDSVVYVKVIGALPLRNNFKGCSLGLSNEARAALGARDSRAFCEISFADF